MYELLSLALSGLALLIALWALWKVAELKRDYEERMANALATLLDEWENENRRFMSELEKLHQQLLQQLHTAERSSLHGTTAPPVIQTTVPEPEKPSTPPPASTFQKLLEEVLAMKKEGKTEAEIARLMNRGVGEIQFILQSAAFQKKNRT